MSEIREELMYTKDHEWITKPDEEGMCTIGVTDHAQTELGDIVYIEVDVEGETLERDAVFGTIEAVTTVSDLFIPIGCNVTEINHTLEDNPDLVNSDPYGEGWIVKVKTTPEDFDCGLLTPEQYKEEIGQ